MPVIGHAFVGLGTAIVTRPKATRAWTAPFWTPSVVALAYLPDIVAHGAGLAGVTGVRHAAHSVLPAAALSIPIGLMLAWVFSVSLVRGISVALFSILAHDLLDLARTTDRRPWWPVSDRVVGLDFNVIPTDTFHEALVFAAAFAVFLLTVRAVAPRRGRVASVRPQPTGCAARWMGRAAVLVILLAASTTHYLRGQRDQAYETVRTLLGRRRYAEALAMMPEVTRWPSTAKPGRIDYIRADALLAMGDRSGAESSYLRSFRRDPSYFWLVADLAVFYADSDDAVERRLAAPYVRKLREQFADHEAQPRMLAKIAGKLSASDQ